MTALKNVQYYTESSLQVLIYFIHTKWLIFKIMTEKKICIFRLITLRKTTIKLFGTYSYLSNCFGISFSCYRWRVYMKFSQNIYNNIHILTYIIFTTLYTTQLHISVGQAMISMVSKAEQLYRIKMFIKHWTQNIFIY